jgi:murein DD-endopeptidase MepM/ murein hydrolase activator NlpD
MKKRLFPLFVLLVLLAIFVHIPVSGGQLTSWYGLRFSTDNLFHLGSDIGLPTGSSVVPVSAGTVREAGFDERKGYYIVMSHFFGLFESRYLHLNSIAINKGDEVSSGDVIGYSGNSGYSTGPHLHFEIRLFRIPLPAYLLCLPNKIAKAGIGLIAKAQ